MPMVIVLHGRSGSGANMRALGFDKHAATANTVIVYPGGGAPRLLIERRGVRQRSTIGPCRDETCAGRIDRSDIDGDGAWDRAASCDVDGDLSVGWHHAAGGPGVEHTGRGQRAVDSAAITDGLRE